MLRNRITEFKGAFASKSSFIKYVEAPQPEGEAEIADDDNSRRVSVNDGTLDSACG
jgi:hypothetical protein